MVWASAVTVRSLGAAPAMIAGAFHGTVMTGAGAMRYPRHYHARAARSDFPLRLSGCNEPLLPITLGNLLESRMSAIGSNEGRM
jgi:hypothetical protein